MLNTLRWTLCPNLAGGVEARVKDANQLLFTIAGGFFRGAKVEFNSRHAAQQPDDSARTEPVLRTFVSLLEVAVCKDRALPTYKTPSDSPHRK